MTERRDPTALGTPQPEATEPAPRRRLERPRTGTPVPRRLAVAGLALSGAAGLAGWIGLKVSQHGVSWLHAQPSRQLPFGKIALLPEPPPYIRIGQAGLLEAVRRESKWPATLDVLALDLGEVARIFKLSPWVASVEEVRRGYPNRLEVRLTYKRPVARNVDKGPRFFVDREGDVLPEDEFDDRRAGTLLELTGLKDPAPLPGHALAGARAAARLADFLLNREDVASLGQPARIVRVNAKHGDNTLFVRSDDKLWILWGDAPGAEAPGAPTAESKWAYYRAWRRANPTPVAGSWSDDQYLVFGRDGARLN